ncbi:hypothetical protein [Parapedobacter sp. 2B3]|uniref:hypothetical protein n=1 Tax=Parapedobacter sp. 2B3 TaxID=3342381 RepID=UPI0035B582DD
MKGRKNDYSMTFYDGEIRRLFMQYVHNTDTAIRWVDAQNIRWSHAMVYDRRTRAKIARIVR